MMGVVRTCLLPVGAIVILGVVSCNPGITGGSTETGNAKAALVVTGTVVDDTLNPRSGVDVRLLPDEYNPALSDFPVDSLFLKTGSNGHFAFTIHDTDTVTLTARDSRSGKSAIVFHVAASDTGDDTLALGRVRLVEPVSVSLTLDTDVHHNNTVVFIPGTLFQTVIDTIRTVVIDSIPNQRFSLIYYDLVSRTEIARADSVQGAASCRAHEKSFSTQYMSYNVTVIECE